MTNARQIATDGLSAPLSVLGIASDGFLEPIPTVIFVPWYDGAGDARKKKKREEDELEAAEQAKKTELEIRAAVKASIQADPHVRLRPLPAPKIVMGIEVLPLLLPAPKVRLHAEHDVELEEFTMLVAAGWLH